MDRLGVSHSAHSLSSESDSFDPDPLTAHLRDVENDDIDFEEETLDDTESEITPGSSTPTASDIPSPGSDRSSESFSSCSSRNRYLYPKIDTVEALRPEQVRWFYRADGEHVKGKPKWTPFIGYDSLRIECKYREVLHRDEDAAEENVEMVIVRGGLYEVDVISRKCYPIYWSPKGETAIIMRGTWFMDNTWFPLEDKFADQMESEHMSMFDGQKIPEENAETITKGPPPVIHHIKFKEFHVDWNAIDRVFLHSEATSSKFYRAVGTKLGLTKAGTRLHRGYCYEATMDDKPPDISHLVFVVHGIGQKMDTGSITRSCAYLREGCQKMKKFFVGLDEANKRPEFLPVEWRSSLRLDGDIVDAITPNKVRGLRSLLNVSAMDIMYYTSPLYRTEIVQGLQQELNRLYTMFCTRHPYFEASGGKVSIVAHSLGCVITYDIITGWNPIQLYDQYVSSVLDPSFKPVLKDSDVLSICDADQEMAQAEGTAEIVAELERARQRVSELETDLLTIAQQQHLKTPTLKFKLEHFFCLGSPLAVFLALRGVRPKGAGTQDHILPKSLCRRLFNIYHPSDPIAYRLEPLILKHYSTISPLRIHRSEAPNKQSYDKMKPQAYAAMTSPEKHKDTKAEHINGKVPEDAADETERKKEEANAATQEDTVAEIQVNLEETKTEEIKVKEKGRLGGMFSRWSRKKGDKLTAEMTDMKKKETNTVPAKIDIEDDYVNIDDSAVEEIPIPIDHTDLEYRLDYQLKEGKMQSAYIATLTSHTSYWSNIDVALFMLTQLFPDYGPS